MAESIQEKEARYGEKMIEVKVRFWTNDIAEGKGRLKPRHAWTTGVVRMERNESHGIIPGYPRPFNSLMEIPVLIEKILMEHEITLHRDKKMEKYIK